MSKKNSQHLKTAAGIIIVVLLGYLVYLSLKGKPVPQESESVEVALENKEQVPELITNQQMRDEIPKASEVRNVSPVFGLESLIEDVTSELSEESDRAMGLLRSKNRYLSLKEKGHTFWKSEEWMKEPEYYKSLDTISLASECFQRTIFSLEMIGFDDPAYAFQRLEIFHNGFMELFQRDDMWEGILRVHYDLSEKINPDYDFKIAAQSSLQLSNLRYFYSYAPFKKQLNGHEQEFLKANIAVIKKYIAYLDTYDPEKLGIKADESPFNYTACSVAEVALMLMSKVDPQRYVVIKNEVSSVKWGKTSTALEVKRYLELIVRFLDENNNPDNL